MIAKGVSAFVIVALVWEAARALGILSPRWAPSVFSIAEAMWANLVDGTWARVLAPTLFAWLVGLTFAIAGGVFLGCLAGASVWFRASQSVLTSFLRTTPAIALVPIAIFIFGLRPAMVLSLVIFGCLWPMLFNTLYAFREIPVQYAETARVLGYSRLTRFFRVELVATLPGIVTGVRIAASIGLVITVSTELLVGSSGLGGFILQQRSSAQLGAAYAGIVVGGLLGISLVGLIGLVQRRLLPWSTDNRKIDA